MRDARLEAGRLQRMRHARARLEVVSIEAVLRLLPLKFVFVGSLVIHAPSWRPDGLRSCGYTSQAI